MKMAGRHLHSAGSRVENPSNLIKGELIEGNYAFRYSFYHSLRGCWRLYNVSEISLRMPRGTGCNWSRVHCNSWRDYSPSLVAIYRELTSMIFLIIKNKRPWEK